MFSLEGCSPPQRATNAKVQICILRPRSVKCGRCHPFYSGTTCLTVGAKCTNVNLYFRIYITFVSKNIAQLHIQLVETWVFFIAAILGVGDTLCS